MVFYLPHSVRKWLGTCAEISGSPTIRNIMSAKLLRFRYPEARFLTIFDNTDKTLADGISQISIRESDNVIEVTL